MNNRNFTLPVCLVILVIALQNPLVSNSKLNPVVLILGIVLYFVLDNLYCSKESTMTRPIYDSNEINILLQEYVELRNEIKQRIQQRDTMTIQSVVAVCTVISLAATTKLYWLLCLLPILVCFYTIQIYESYSVHERLVEFIRESLEVRIKILIDPDTPMWETYCARIRDLTLDQNIGGRKQFMTSLMFITPILSCALQILFAGCSFVLLYYAAFLLVSFVVWYRDAHRLVYTGLNKLAYCDYLRKADRTDEPTKAVFLDKDGTLHVDKVMTHRWRDLELLPGAKEFVKRAHDAGYLVIIVTNQSAIGKGIYSVGTMHRFIWLLRQKLKWVDAVYYCPHKFGVECNCRKPKTGMFERAVKELNVNLADSIMIGDRESDVNAGKNAGVGRNIMVATGLYETESDEFEVVSRIDEIQL